LKGDYGVKDDLFKRGLFVVGDGMTKRFWEDSWLGDTPFASQYLSLYDIVRHKNVMVTYVSQNRPLITGFTRLV
jgi:hypothetical protein